MMNSEKQTIKSSSYKNHIIIILLSIYTHTYFIIPNVYTDVQIHMIEGILSAIIPLSIGLIACYFISREKTQKRLYIEMISYIIGISAILQMSMLASNAVESFFPSLPQWTYYLIATILLIPIPILELYNNTKIKKRQKIY